MPTDSRSTQSEHTRLYIEQAQKIDANLRAGGRYPYTPNPKYRKGLSNPIFSKKT